ncbi:MAG: type I-E CRISPR-associated protein Cas7/Cse4/CasC [Corynebacterium sp.]|nr:type I-E CRISPR-associated protein Cas7/Cse4/CasC [Corynebacterium sp.]
MSIVVDINALHTLPPSLINRDDTGAPKTAIFGGSPRQRVSSQSWKRAVRKLVEDKIDPELVGVRSKRTPADIAAKIHELEPSWTEEQIVNGISALYKAAGIKLQDVKKAKDAESTDNEENTTQYQETGYLLFLSPHQIERAAKEIIDHDGEKFSKADAASILDTEHSMDIAMFGRMLADAPSYNVDAAVQVAHAISVHAAEPEFDYFTAVDDLVEDAEEIGAGMIGTVQMMSSTLYRYATINMGGLAENLGNVDAAIEAAGHFVRAFVESMPMGKINTFANETLPELVYIAIRDTRPVSLVNAFEEPIEETTGRRKEAAQRLAAEEHAVEETYGFTPLAAFVVALDDLGDAFADLAEKTTMPQLGDKLEARLRAAIQEG